MAQDTTELQPDPEVSADVVIIGSGATGLPAAIVAAEGRGVRAGGGNPTMTWAATPS